MAARDFTRLLQSCGQRQQPNAWEDELSAMERLLNTSPVKATNDAPPGQVDRHPEDLQS